ncbi:MAG: hypothetical protein K0B15_09850 [Lentimicrobium sp.]|nr:hypothetical protein [Lentimicrobium sp.]
MGKSPEVNLLRPPLIGNGKSKDQFKTHDPTFETEDIKDSISTTEDYNKHGFFIKESKYWTTVQKGKNSYNVTLSNFVMKSLYHLVNGSNNSKRLIMLQRNTGEKYLIEVFSSELKPESFETILKSHGCTFQGSAYQLKLIFSQLMDHETQATTLPILGWNGQHRIFVFADSIFTKDERLIQANKYGIVNDGKTNYYLSSASLANKEDQDLDVERLYCYRPGLIDFKEWSKLLYQSFGPNAVLGILYLILAIYRDVVFYHVGFFPFLFLFGAKGTGKTSFTDKFLRLFGRDVTGTPLNNASIPGMSRQVSGRNNVVFYFKEYVGATDDLIEAFILNGYDGAGRLTATKSTDYRTKSYPVRSAIMFDGNYLPSKNQANFSRMIILFFEKENYTPEEQYKYKEFEQLSKEGFGKVLLDILKLRPIIEAKFLSTYKSMCKSVSHEAKALDERSINHTALLLTVYEVLENELSFPFLMEEAKEIVLENARQHSNQLIETGPVHKFWEAFAHNVQNYKLVMFDGHNRSSSHYNIKYQEDVKIILQIKIQPVWTAYMRYCKENSIQPLDSNSLKSLLTSSGNQSFIPSSQKGRYKSYTDKWFGSCYQFWAEKTDFGFLINDIEVNV